MSQTKKVASFFKYKKGTNGLKTQFNAFFFQKTETLSGGLAINEWRPKNRDQLSYAPFPSRLKYFIHAKKPLIYLSTYIPILFRLKIFKSNVKSGPNLDRQGPNPKSKSESRSRRKSTDFSGNSNNGKKNGNKNEINDRQKTLVPEENINGKHVTIKVDKANSKKIMSNEDATKKMILDNHKEGDDFACPFGECTEFDLVSLEAVVEHLKVSHQNYQLPSKFFVNSIQIWI